MTSLNSKASHLLLLAAAALIVSSNSSEARSPERREAVRQLPGPSERWALVVGVGKYKDAFLHELYGDRDATAFANVLEQRASFSNDHIVLLAGQDTKDCRPVLSSRKEESAPTRAAVSEACQPTFGNVMAYLTQLTREMSAKGLFVFYFSGHGEYVDGESVLYLSDIRYMNDQLYLKKQGLTATELAHIIRSRNIKQVLIFLDACRNQLVTTMGPGSGSASENFSFDLDRLNANVEAFMTFYSTRQTLFAYEDSKEKRSYFASELLHAFDAAYDTRNLLTLGGLVKFVQKNVASRVELDKGKKQLPDVQISGYLPDDLVVAARANP